MSYTFLTFTRSVESLNALPKGAIPLYYYSHSLVPFRQRRTYALALFIAPYEAYSPVFQQLVSSGKTIAIASIMHFHSKTGPAINRLEMQDVIASGYSISGSTGEKKGSHVAVGLLAKQSKYLA